LTFKEQGNLGLSKETPEGNKNMALPISFSTAKAATTPRESDRRSLGRFPIERELRFRMMSKRNEIVGSGRTVNMSSKGLLFRTDKTLMAGKRLEMAISWPAQLDFKCALKLIARGKIVRAEPGLVAVSIEQYEFRTLGTAGLSV
jgi:hypothetical protein